MMQSDDQSEPSSAGLATAWLPILTLTFAAFAIGSTELAIQGLLPEIAADLGVSIPRAGLLVTGYALGVAVGGPIAAVATNGLRRKTALLVLLGIFVIGHVLCALAPNYSMLMAARVVASFCHGAFMGIGSVVAVSIVREDRRASAVALMWAGIAAANIAGVPVGTALGHAFGWRSTFWAIMIVGLLAALAMSLWLPDTGPIKKTRLFSEFKVLGVVQVQFALALSVFVCAATFSVFTYIAPILIAITGVSSGALPLYFLAFGVGGVVGMQVGGRLGDRNAMASIIGAFAADALVFVVLLFALHERTLAFVTMFAWGFAFYFMAAPIQLRVVDAGREAPNLASTLIQSAFNLGVALGPFVGAAALSAGMSYALLPVCGALLALAGVGAAIWSALRDRRSSAQASA
jgi:MFS transporter, DHA1 family, inner membrane transport protein